MSSSGFNPRGRRMDSYEQAMIADAFPRYAWRTAATCGPNGGNCVEVNLDVRGLAGLRDSKAVTGAVLGFGGEGWAAFVDAAKSGRLDRG
jgi:hypothetical protein